VTRNVISAVERQHDIAGLANPVATFAVRLALNKPATVEAPRSWRASEKLMVSPAKPKKPFLLAKPTGNELCVAAKMKSLK
jgi:hypothetical protein